MHESVERVLRSSAALLQAQVPEVRGDEVVAALLRANWRWFGGALADLRKGYKLEQITIGAM